MVLMGLMSPTSASPPIKLSSVVLASTMPSACPVVEPASAINAMSEAIQLRIEYLIRHLLG